MKVETPSLTCEQMLEKIRNARDSQQLLATLPCQDLNYTSLHAVYLVQSLFSEHSSDQSNINRITVNLEAAAADLLALSQSLKQLL
jgi:hypothetical protein